MGGSDNQSDCALCGGLNNDILDGSPGNDILYGGAGNDILFGSPGNDILEYSSHQIQYTLITVLL